MSSKSRRKGASAGQATPSSEEGKRQPAQKKKNTAPPSSAQAKRTTPTKTHPFQRFFRSASQAASFSQAPPEGRSAHSPSAKPTSPLPEKIRLVRYVALAGIASRRNAIKIIQNGQITVNGETVREPWRYVDTHKDQVAYKGQLIRPEKPVYILLNKPKDTLCTVKDEKGRRTVLDLLVGAPPVRLYPVGRLDRHTTGILLLTNDGDLAQKLLHPRSKVPRTYRATSVKPFTQEVVERLLRGVPLPDGVAQADEAYLEDSHTLVITVHIGRKHIVRRMLEHLGYRLKSLDRIAFGPITRKGVARGRWRFLTPQEVAWLKMVPDPRKISPSEQR